MDLIKVSSYQLKNNSFNPSFYLDLKSTQFSLDKKIPSKIVIALNQVYNNFILKLSSAFFKDTIEISER